MLAGIAASLVVDLPEVDPVRQQMRERSVGKRHAAGRGAGCESANARDYPLLSQLPLQRGERSPRQVALEDQPDGRRLRLVDQEFFRLDPVTERHDAADPDPALLRRRDLVADALTRDLALELGEGQQHVERQPPHAGRRVERLSDRHERHAADVEQLNELREVGKRSRQTVDLVDDDDVDPTRPHQREKALQCRTLHRAAGEASVREHAVPNELPPLPRLAADVGLRRLRCASRELKSCSSRWSVETRV